MARGSFIIDPSQLLMGCCLDMTNTGKLMIVGLLVVDAGVAAYLLYPRDDQVPAVSGEVTRGVTGAIDPESQTDAARAAVGSVLPAQPVNPPAARENAANNAAMAPQSAPSQRESAAPAPAPVQPQAQAPAPAPAPSQPVTAATPTPGISPDSGQSASGRIDSPAPLTVNPPPVAQAHARPQPYAQQRNQSRPQYGPRIDYTQAQTQPRRRDDAHPNGSNPVAAMLTDQLVKESAKPDPSLPMPSGVTVPTQPDNGAAPGPVAGNGRSTNPVASAMTDRLVRESSRVGQAPAQAQSQTPSPPAAEPPILKP